MGYIWIEDQPWVFRLELQAASRDEAMAAVEAECGKGHIVALWEGGSPLKWFTGFVWIDDRPGIRLGFAARSWEDAQAIVAAEYGEGHQVYLCDVEAANRPR